MKKAFLPAAISLLTGCQWIHWHIYRQAALDEGYVPIPPEELFPENPEQGRLDSGEPYLAGAAIDEQERARYCGILQQASQVRICRVRQAGNDCWSLETTSEELPVRPINEEFRRLVQRWGSAPAWLRLTPCNVDFAGIFISCDQFHFLDVQGKELGSISIGLSNPIVCKPPDQPHYDDLRKLILQSLGLSN